MTANSIFDKRYQKHHSAKMIDRLCRFLVRRQLSHISRGQLLIEENDDVFHCGQPSQDRLVAKICVDHPGAWRIVLLGGSIGAAEAFMSGGWSSPDLTKVIRMFCRNRETLQVMDSRFSIFRRWILRITKRLSRNTLEGSRHNIAAHYDLGNDFFKLFLDPSMMYSSAIYAHPEQPLQQASINKLRLTCERLELQSSDHLLEIGTGWGGMAIYAAEKYGCRVTTTTISKEQYNYTCERVRKKNLAHRVKVLFCDYRLLTGQYDKIVSIEMIEAVGAEYYPTFFRQCDSLLKDKGRMVLQAITIPDHDFERYADSVDFIRQYIFPGGCLPSIQILSLNAEKHSELTLAKTFDITSHYAQTLSTWRDEFFKKLKHIKSMAFDDNFIRMWDYYLSYCEGGFLERHSTTHQLAFVKQ